MYARKYAAWIAILCVAAFVFGCSDDDNATDPGGGTPSAGGSVGPLGDTLDVVGQLKLIIPPGALTDTVDFTITQNASPLSPPGAMGFVCNCYTIGPSGTNFNIPALLILNYNEGNVGNADESEIVMYTNDGGGWDQLLTTVDAAANKIAAPITHLSDFAGMVDTTPVVSEGVFTRLIVGRNITYIGAGDPYKTDSYEAVFDSSYAPCDPVDPIGTVNVTCNSETLIWNEYAGIYTYPEVPMPMNNIIILGANYTFTVTAGGGVPALTQSITFPSHEPYITYPTMMTTLGRSGFDILWAGGGGGVVELTFMDSNGQLVIFEETANDGSYSVSSSTLSGLPSGECVIILSHHNRETFTAAGYDSRSFIAARVMSQTMFTLE